ncbi:MAG: tRNA pseudouridine(55) synthase TruB [bacterium]
MNSKILLLNKHKGTTSNNQLQKLKKVLGQSKAGFSGTLDPLASGVLPIFFNNSTKLIQYVPEESKIYRVKAILGITTNTLDICGEVKSIKNYKSHQHLTNKIIEEAINSCIGEFKYKLPKFSAIKIDGKKSYELARSNKNFEPKERISSIKSIEIIDIRKLSFEMIVKCSPGTYIRSLVDSIGQTLTIGATVTKLERIQSGPFLKKDSYSLGRILDDNFEYYDLNKLFKTFKISERSIKKLILLRNYKKVNIADIFNDSVSGSDLKNSVLRDNLNQFLLKTSNENMIFVSNSYDEGLGYLYSKIKII